MIIIALLLAGLSYTGYSNFIGNFAVGQISPDALITNSQSTLTLKEGEAHTFVLQTVDSNNQPSVSIYYWRVDGVLKLTTQGTSSVYIINQNALPSVMLTIGNHVIDVTVIDLLTHAENGHYTANIQIISSSSTPVPTTPPTPIVNLMVDNISPTLYQTVYFTVFTTNLPQGSQVNLHAYVNGQEVNIPYEKLSQLTPEGVGTASAIPGQIAQRDNVPLVAWKVDVNGVYSNYVTTTVQNLQTTNPTQAPYTSNPTPTPNNPTPTPYNNYPTPTAVPDDEITIVPIGSLDFNLFGYIGAAIMGVIGSVLVVKSKGKKK